MKMKKICTLLSAAIAMFAVTAAQLPASAKQTAPTITNTDFQTEQGSKFTTTLYIPKNSNIAVFEAVLNYDTSCVTLTGAKACENKDGQVVINDKENGKIYLTYTAAENQTAQINVAELTFQVADDLAGDAYNFITLDTTEENVASSNAEDGSFTDHELKSDFSALTIYQYGDADLDGAVRAKDVTYLKQYIVKMHDLSEISKKYANTYMDYEKDGVTPKVNSRDAMLIQQKVVRMNVNLGDRVTVTFYNKDGSVYAKKSIKAGSALLNVPTIPELTGYSSGNWSTDADEQVAVDFDKIESDLNVYAVYAEADNNVAIYEKTVEALELGFAEAGKYIADDFQLPYKNNYGTFNMLSSSEFSGVDIIWSIDSGLLAQSVVISKDYVVDVPELDYTTWVTFKANIFIDGEKYGTHDFKREIKGEIDMPSPTVFKNVLKDIPKELPEHYRLPGYMTLESSRMNYGVELVQNVDIHWSVVKNEDGSSADARVLDTNSNEIIYLKDKNNVTFQADFVFDGNIVYTDRISRTIPAKPMEEQIAYAQEYIKRFVPSVISGETYFPTSVPLYDLTVSWVPDIESGKVVIGDNVTVNDVTYKAINVGKKAGYMEWASVYANIERNGDDSFKSTGLGFDVQLAGNSSEISTTKIPDENLYNALVKIFDTKYGNGDKILTEEEIYDTDVMEKLNYTIDLSNKGIKNISGIKYLKYYRIIDLSDNDLSGTNASLGDLASLNYLEQISLSNCKISEIPESVFASKHLIEGIDLSYNRLKDVDFLSLKDSRTNTDMAYPELKELFLQGNYISDISNLAFKNDQGEIVSRIPKVTVLTLSRDLNYYEYKTGALGKPVFKDKSELEYDITTPMDIAPIGLLKNVTTLWLANNYITDISPLSSCTVLATLDLSGNSITANAVTDGLAPISKLQSLVCLKLDNNDIQTVRSLKRLIYLDILSLSNNQIGNVSGIIDSMSLLTYLDLDNNELSTFDAGNFSRLKRLYLENNKLVQVQNLNAATGLVELRLNNNTVDSETISSIAALTGLNYLSLSGNTVVDLNFLNDLTALTHLELARCNIRQQREVSVPNTATGETVTEKVDNLGYLRNLKGLTILDLSDNPEINDISALSTLTNLGVFYINNVGLDNAQAIRSMTKLQYLSMQNSGVSDLSFLNTLSLLKFLNLAGHNAAALDFANIKSNDNIMALFLDSASGSDAINLKSFINKGQLKFLSLNNMKVNSVDNLPDMDAIVYLGLRNTNINDFNGTNYETDGYLNSLTRFDTLKCLDVADNPELFTKKNLEMLYDFVRKPKCPVSIVLYRDDAPEGYVPGVMNAEVEAKRLKQDIDFGTESTDIMEAMSAGYPLQETLDGYDIKWDLEENDLYYVKDGKLYFVNTSAEDSSLKLSLKMNIVDLYYRKGIEGSTPETPVSFKASIQTTTESKFVETVFVKREFMTSQSETVEGWTQDPELTELGYSDYGEWSDWSEKKITESDLVEVETKTESGFTDWGAWSNWSETAVTGSDLRKVETKEDPRSQVTGYKMFYYLTQGASSPHYRHYRNFSINGNYSAYGARTSYGEHVNSMVIDVATFNNATAVASGGFSKGGSAGYNKASVTGYNFSGDQGAMWFKGDAVTKNYTVKMYRYCDRSATSTTLYRSRERTKVPTTYHFYRDVYEDVYEDVISGMTLIVE